MTFGEALELAGLAALFAGLFLVVGVGWALAVCGLLLVAAGELLDRRAK